MTLTVIKTDKSKSFLLSEQVKRYLNEKGFLKVFNYSDYEYFKRKVTNARNKAQEIANLFIEENQHTTKSDFNEYIF
ncbi:hypothetical protein [Lutibacter sp.]|uniref:hypothetical protein n=1 Tax=Lutibacter sp. TaxID=1925666 RepID=UPI0035667D15